MGSKDEQDVVYAVSPDVVAREVHGEFLIIPITSGIGDLEDEIFTLNETGQAIWNRLDGKQSLRDLAAGLGEVFDGSPDEIGKDVAGLTGELLKKRMIVEVK